MIVDEVQSAVLEEASAAIRPIEDEEVIVRTEEDDESYFWKIIDVDLGIALCQSLEREEHQEEVILSYYPPEIVLTAAFRSIFEI